MSFNCLRTWVEHLICLLGIVGATYLTFSVQVIPNTDYRHFQATLLWIIGGFMQFSTVITTYYGCKPLRPLSEVPMERVFLYDVVVHQHHSFRKVPCNLAASGI